MAQLHYSWLHASYKLWENHLRQFFSIISLLNKPGDMFVTFVLPNPNTCSSYELSMSHKLPFLINKKHYLHVLDMIYYDL